MIIKNPYELADLASTTVMANGCFDIFHIGHLLHLQAARQLGERLIVVVTADQNINKGPNRPIFSETARAEIINSLRCVDYVYINRFEQPGLELFCIIRPNIYVKGSEYRNKMTPELVREKACVEQCGGKLVFTDEPEFHSTQILERICKLD